jgi:hypothetical protein
MKRSLDPAHSEIQRSFMGAECSSSDDQSVWLYEHGMLPELDTPYDVTTDADWQQRGAETYSLFFSIQQRQKLMRFVMKACVASPPLTERVSSWLQRRTLLEAEGIQVPRLHAVDRATYIEEYIDHDLNQAYRIAEPTAQAALRDQFVALHTTTRQLGFRPVSFHDVRSRGTDVVAIDFGADLGGVFDNPSAQSLGSIEQIARKEFDDIIR